MTDHLPECDTFRFTYGEGYGGCICEWLRACEERVEETWSAIAGRDQYAEGYRAALNVALEAVETLPLIVRFVKENKTKLIDQLIDRDEAVAAIDALREKP